MKAIPQEKQQKRLIGKTVMVAISNTSDPRKGDFGRIVAVSGAPNNVVTLQFDDLKKADYNAAALQILIPAIEIKRNALLYFDKWKNGEAKIMLDAFLLLSKRKVRDAFTLVMSNPVTAQWCTVDCRDWIAHGHELKHSSNKKHQRNP